MNINGIIICILLGSILGIFIAAKIGIGDIINQIDKVKTKGDNSPIDVIQNHSKQPQTEKKGIFRKIFKRKQK